MFFVYIPVVSVTAYFCAKHFLPSPVHRTLSRVLTSACVAAAFAAVRVAKLLSAARTDYIWDKRLRLPGTIVGVLDTVLRVDKAQALLDTSTGHKSIAIESAIATVGGRDYDITGVLIQIWAYGNGIRVEVPVNCALRFLQDKVALDYSCQVTTRVRYRGHSNVAKRYPSQTFSVRYECQAPRSFLFPPYPASASVRRGLSVPRILRANFLEENGRLLYGSEAAESAGLRRNYYEDVEDDPSIVKKAISFFEPSTRAQEKQEIVVTTSKSKVLCNT